MPKQKEQPEKPKRIGGFAEAHCGELDELKGKKIPSRSVVSPSTPITNGPERTNQTTPSEVRTDE